MPVIQGRSKNYGDGDERNRVKNWLTNSRILTRHKNREESCLSDQGFSVQPIYSDIFLCSSDWSGTHCELELSHSNPPASSY